MKNKEPQCHFERSEEQFARNGFFVDYKTSLGMAEWLFSCGEMWPPVKTPLFFGAGLAYSIFIRTFVPR